LNTLKGLDVLRRRPLQTSKKLKGDLTRRLEQTRVGWGVGWKTACLDSLQMQTYGAKVINLEGDKGPLLRKKSDTLRI